MKKFIVLVLSTATFLCLVLPVGCESWLCLLFLYIVGCDIIQSITDQRLYGEGQTAQKQDEAPWTNPYRTKHNRYVWYEGYADAKNGINIYARTDT